MTERLYYSDSYTTKFEAEIVDVKNINGKTAVVLDKTYFYPTSGGQEHDTGYINTAKVIDVILSEDGEILHIIEGEVSPGKVECVIDWERRFSNMQQHTGQHILSRAFEVLLDCETVSSRLGDDIGTIDLDGGNLNYDKIHEVEELANKIVWENRDVKIHFADASEISKYPLRKPPKVSGTVRIIEVKEFDFSPCGGTHVSRTGEIGLIKIRRWERVKGGLTRVEFVCGIRALRDFQSKNKISNELISILSVPETELPNQISKILEMQKEKQKLINSLTEKIIEFEAEKLLQSSEKINGINFIIAKFENRPVDELKIFARKFLNTSNTVSVLGSKTDGANVIMTRSPEIEIDLREILKEVLSIIEGRGGGKADFVQCGGSAENFEKMFDITVEKLKTKLS